MTLEEIKDLANKRVITDVTFVEQYMKDNKLANVTYDELANLGIISHIVKDGSSLSEPEETSVEDPETPVEDPETPVEEPETPVEDPKTPVEEPETPVEEPETPVEEEIVVDEGEVDEE